MKGADRGAAGRWSSVEQLAAILKECLEEGKQVEIDGLGLFRPGPLGRFEFIPQDRPQVFLAYVQEDAAAAERLFDRLRKRGFDPWLDRRKLLPGQNWPRSIQEAIETCDFFVACFSLRSVRKKGGFQAEIRYALDCARRVPLDDTFLIPLRLDECPVPTRIRNEIQYIDLFPDWERGFRRVVRVMDRQLTKRRRLDLPEPQAA
jgi:TIR domain